MNFDDWTDVDTDRTLRDTEIDAVDFDKAKVGQQAYTYCRPDHDMIGDYGWLTGLEWFEERDGEEKLLRQRWLLVAEDEIVLPDPYRLEDDD